MIRFDMHNMHRQQGLSLSGLIAWLIILALVGLLGIKVLPELIDYGSSVKVITAVAKDPDMKESPESTIRNSFGKRAEIDNIRNVRPDDLIIDKTGGNLVISFAYEKKIHLFGPVSLTLDLEHSTAK